MTSRETALTRRGLFRSAFATGVLSTARWALLDGQQSERPVRTEGNLAGLLPPASLNVVGFFPAPPGYSRDEHMKWYEGTHALDFAFAWPHCARYTRNYVVASDEGGPPEFQVITEIAYPSEAAKKEIARLFSTPAAAGLATHHPPVKADAPAPKPGALTTANRMISVEERLISGPSLTGDPVPPTRRIVVLTRAAMVSEQEFLLAADTFAWNLSESIARPNVRVNLTIRRPGTNAGFADGLVAIDHLSDGPLPLPKSTAVQVMHVLQVEAHSSKVG